MPSLPTLTPAAGPGDLGQLLDHLATRPEPALVFYDAHGDRVELSGRVLENWVAKTANMFVDDLGLDSGDVIHLDSAVHWRTVVVALAALRMGAVVAPVHTGADTTQTPRVLVVQDGPDGTPDGSATREADDVVVLAYPALAMSLEPGRLPSGAIDYCAQIRAHGDHWSGASRPDPGATAIIEPGNQGTEEPHRSQTTEVSHAAFFTAAVQRAESAELTGACAIHVSTSRLDTLTMQRLVAGWLAGATMVLTDHEGTSHRFLANERVTLTWG